MHAPVHLEISSNIRMSVVAAPKSHKASNSEEQIKTHIGSIFCSLQFLLRKYGQNADKCDILSCQVKQISSTLYCVQLPLKSKFLSSIYKVDMLIVNMYSKSRDMYANSFASWAVSSSHACRTLKPLVHESATFDWSCRWKFELSRWKTVNNDGWWLTNAEVHLRQVHDGPVSHAKSHHVILHTTSSTLPFQVTNHIQP